MQKMCFSLKMHFSSAISTYVGMYECMFNIILIKNNILEMN
jgi:hypothetical protein